MAGNVQPYLFNPAGDGVRAPIRQTAIRDPNGLLRPATASLLYSRRRAKPNVFASTITSRYSAANVAPSSFAQYGRGRMSTTTRRRLNPGVTSTRLYQPTYGGVNFIKKAIKRPGAFKSYASKSHGLTPRGTISKKFIAQTIRHPSSVARLREAVLARTLAGLRRSRTGSRKGRGAHYGGISLRAARSIINPGSV